MGRGSVGSCRWDGPKGDGESIGGGSVERGGGGYSCGGGRCDDWGSDDNGSGDSRGWGAAAAQAGELEHDDQEAKGELEAANGGEAEVVVLTEDQTRIKTLPGLPRATHLGRAGAEARPPTPHQLLGDGSTSTTTQQLTDATHNIFISF